MKWFISTRLKISSRWAQYFEDFSQVTDDEVVAILGSVRVREQPKEKIVA